MTIGRMTQSNEWQPIETAPKDRTIIMLRSPGCETGIGYLEDGTFDGVPYIGGSVAWAGRWRGDQKNSVWMGGWRAEESTHWMPLPAPPSGSSEPPEGPTP